MAVTYSLVPTAEVIEAFEAEQVYPLAWCDIYEADNATVWEQGVPLTEGRVSVDWSRDERRNLDVTFYDLDQVLGYGPGHLWFDKILKPYKGIVLPNKDVWVAPLGEFLIDTVERPHFPRTIKITARDFVKKMKLSKVTAAQSFASGSNVRDIIWAIAVNAGIGKFNMPAMPDTLAAAVTFERGQTRWECCKQLAESISCDLYFAGDGFLTLAPMVDPISAPIAYSFRTGNTGNMVTFSKSSSDVEMFNEVLVYGEGPDNPTIFAVAENNTADSPTRIAAIGRRTMEFRSQFIDTTTKAEALASKFLKVAALEQFEVSIESISLPWMEAGKAIEFLDPDAAANDPTRFIYTDFDISFGLGPMSGNAKRVTIVG